MWHMGSHSVTCTQHNAHAIHSEMRPVTIIFLARKKMLGGQKFASDMAVQWAVRQWLAQQPTSFFAWSIHKLVDRWDKCLNKLGNLKINQNTPFCNIYRTTLV